MALHFRVAFLGFSDFERSALASYFRLALSRRPRYEQVQMLTDAEYLVADADHAPSVQLVLATERLDETVFIGSQPPPGAVAWLMRPIDALHVMRELDTMVAAEAAAIAIGPGQGANDAARLDPNAAPDAPPGADSGADSGAAANPAANGDSGADPGRHRDVDSAAAAAAAGAPAAATETGAGVGESEPPAPALVLREIEPPAPSLLERAAALQPPPAPADAPVPLPAPAAAEPPPRRMATAADLPALVAVPPPPPRPAAQPQPARALVVDDSEIAQRFLEARLQPWGVLVDRAATSARAIDLLQRASYDLVFLDVELGAASELDGLALCRRIKQSAAAVSASVVMVSAHHSELDRVRGALAGCDAYLAKPLNRGEFERLLLRHGLRAPSAALAAAAEPAAAKT